MNYHFNLHFDLIVLKRNYLYPYLYECEYCWILSLWHHFIHKLFLIPVFCRFRKAGGQIEQRKVNSLQELSESYEIIVNCSGLGAKTLVGDSQVYPVRGQVLNVQAPWLQHFIRDGDGKTYIYPGIHGVTIGGTRQEDDWRLEVDKQDTKSILERCSKLEPSVSKAAVLSEWVGLRPSRKNPRLEREVVLLQGRKVPVVHNYGHGGWGVTLGWGCALDALGLVKQCLHQMLPQARL